MCVKYYFLVCLVCICSATSVLSIRCYQCYLAEHPYFIPEGTPVKTCKDFDFSEDFIQDCPESTFCFKKSSTDYYYKQKFVREERGCAKQLYRGQKFSFLTGWSEDNYIVNDAYKNGCKMADSFGLRSAKTEECYCSDGDYCNSSQMVFSFSFIRLIWVCLVFPVSKVLFLK